MGGRHGLDGLSGLVDARRFDRHDAAERVNEDIEPTLVQGALETVPQQGAQRLAGSHAIQQILRGASAFGGKIDCKRIGLWIRRAAKTGEMPASQYRSRGGMIERRRMYKAGIVAESEKRP